MVNVILRLWSICRFWWSYVLVNSQMDNYGFFVFLYSSGDPASESEGNPTKLRKYMEYVFFILNFLFLALLLENILSLSECFLCFIF